MTSNQSANALNSQKSRTAKKYTLAIADINTELIKIHKILERCIKRSDYQAATAYVDQYISYTTVWNIKFVYNLENPEVTLMQLLHLNYILQQEQAEQLEPLRRAVTEQQAKFHELQPYRDEQIALRKEKMLSFIENYKQH